jgi:BirA family biotin operon repressor/biotin-[acetyl-CoA-carboxylase] ligase
MNDIDNELQDELDYALSKCEHLKVGYGFKALPSTNDYVIGLEKAKIKSGTVVMARRQTHGRGRLHRQWFMEDGDIAMSLLVRAPFMPSNPALLSIIPALALKNALATLNIPAQLKWPNDVIIEASPKDPHLDYFLNFRKICGILVENIFNQHQFVASVVGMGVNVVNQESRKKDLPHLGTLRDVRAHITRRECLAVLLKQLDTLILSCSSSAQQEELIASYCSSCASVGKEVVAEIAGRLVRGKAKRIGSDGALVIHDGYQEHTVYAGDVSVIKTI